VTVGAALSFLLPFLTKKKGRKRYKQFWVMHCTKQEEGTIRSKYAQDITHNAVHGSDSIENAHKEICFFFSETEIYSI
jgi:nucleoside-diphosphate kinase